VGQDGILRAIGNRPSSSIHTDWNYWTRRLHNPPQISNRLAICATSFYQNGSPAGTNRIGTSWMNVRSQLA
jgi:hypothetical protein